MTEIFLKATREKFRFPSARGELTVEMLWDLPLRAKGSGTGFDLNGVAVALNMSVKALGEESFVEAYPDPARETAIAKLEVVKTIIATKQAEAKQRETAAARAQERSKLLVALEAHDEAELRGASREELLKRLAELPA